MAFTFRLSAAQLLQSAALVAALAGGLFWSSLLLTSAESNAPMIESQVSAARSETPASLWFSNQPAAVNIKVSGVMAGAQGAVAILSLNDGPPRSFLLGERLTQGVRVLAIEKDAVVIKRGAEQSRYKVSTLPDSLVLPRLTRP
ncbi:type II secretion system protein N [Pseudomonas sp. FP603]|uniref:type II secretion system protein N n=1 Tax=Pseudomonas sp. FP603 TaxID=2954097 RepID=UPI0027336F45|nr:type II secretion system protein N [Pseudomonas sp. FP603]WLI15247.1 type II secretion system protein N [Pseudomonas sp. FP603]